MPGCVQIRWRHGNRRISPAGLDLKVNADNARAIRFYEKQGFVDAGETVNEISGAPVRLMRWRP